MEEKEEVIMDKRIKGEVIKNGNKDKTISEDK